MIPWWLKFIYNLNSWLFFENVNTCNINKYVNFIWTKIFFDYWIEIACENEKLIKSLTGNDNFCLTGTLLTESVNYGRMLKSQGDEKAHIIPAWYFKIQNRLNYQFRQVWLYHKQAWLLLHPELPVHWAWRWLFHHDGFFRFWHRWRFLLVRYKNDFH